MRAIVVIMLALLLGACDEEEPPVDRVVITAPLKLAASAAKPDLAPLRKVYIDDSAKVAIFFLGDETGMTAHFVSAEGLVDMTRILSRESVAAKPAEDALTAHQTANGLLTSTMLPDRSFQVYAAQGGFLIQGTYGKLSFISYAAVVGDKLKLGGRIDMDLLFKLLQQAGISDACRSLARLGDPASTSDKPGRLLFFTKVPDALAGVLADNASGLFSKVTSAEGGWALASDLTAPTSLSDADAIRAISIRLGGFDPNAVSNVTDENSIYSDGANTVAPYDSMTTNATTTTTNTTTH